VRSPVRSEGGTVRCRGIFSPGRATKNEEGVSAVEKLGCQLQTQGTSGKKEIKKDAEGVCSGKGERAEKVGEQESVLEKKLRARLRMPRRHSDTGRTIRASLVDPRRQSRDRPSCRTAYRLPRQKAWTANGGASSEAESAN